MRKGKTIKRPSSVLEGVVIHRQDTLQATVSERGYFTRYTAGKAKPEVL